MGLSSKRRWALIAVALTLCVIATWTVVSKTVSGPATDAAIGPAGKSTPKLPADRAAPRPALNTPPTQLARHDTRDDLADAVKPQSSLPRTPDPAIALQAPPLPYRYMGRIAVQGAAVEVLLERQDRLSIARVGAILDGLYRVDEIGSQFARLTYLPLNITQIAMAGGAYAAGPQPTDIMLTAPTRATRGSVVEVTLEVPSGPAVKSGNFLLSYDADMLHLLGATDATGAPANRPYHPPGTVELSYNVGDEARQPPAVRFQVTGADEPHSTEIAVTAELFDGAGRVIGVTPAALHSLLVVP